MTLIKRLSIRLASAFLPRAEAGACIPPEFCYCSPPVGPGRRRIYSNCLGNCTLVRELC